MFCADDSFCLSALLRVWVEEKEGWRTADKGASNLPARVSLRVCIHRHRKRKKDISRRRMLLLLLLGFPSCKGCRLSPFFFSLSRKNWWWWGGGENRRNLKRRGRTISYCRDRTLLVQQPILSNAQENAFKVFPATIRPSPPFRLLAFEKCFGSFLGAHREMNSPELFAVLLTLSVCLRLFLSLSLSLCAVCVYV